MWEIMAKWEEFFPEDKLVELVTSQIDDAESSLQGSADFAFVQIRTRFITGRFMGQSLSEVIGRHVARRLQAASR